jgi:hypothetical protein
MSKLVPPIVQNSEAHAYQPTQTTQLAEHNRTASADQFRRISGHDVVLAIDKGRIASGTYVNIFSFRPTGTEAGVAIGAIGVAES